MAITRCRVVAIGKAEFDLLAKEKPEFARHVMKVTADRLRRRRNFALRPRERAPHAGDSIPT